MSITYLVAVTDYCRLNKKTEYHQSISLRPKISSRLSSSSYSWFEKPFNSNWDTELCRSVICCWNSALSLSMFSVNAFSTCIRKGFISAFLSVTGTNNTKRWRKHSCRWWSRRKSRMQSLTRLRLRLRLIWISQQIIWIRFCVGVVALCGCISLRWHFKSQ